VKAFGSGNAAPCHSWPRKEALSSQVPGRNLHPDRMILCLDLQGGFSILKLLQERSGRGI
jgi:hypothetical protein